MADCDDFDGHFFVVMPDQAEQFEDSDDGEVEKGQGHGPVCRHIQPHESPVQGTRMGYSVPTGQHHLRVGVVDGCLRTAVGRVDGDAVGQRRLEVLHVADHADHPATVFERPQHVDDRVQGVRIQ